MTDIAFKPLTAAEKIFKDLIWTPGITAGELALEGYVPFLALPVVKQVDEEVISLFTDWMFNQFVLIVDVAAIRLANAVHQAAYDNASLNLKIIAHDHGIDSDEFRKAKDEAKIALSKFVSFGG